MGGNHLAKKKAINDYGTGIPQHEMEALARVLLPEIEKFYASEEGQRQFAQWKEEQQLEQQGISRVTPKFCVKSNECRNRAKFICRRQRLDRLPPMFTT